MRNVIVNYPKDMSVLHDIMANEIAKIMVNKLQPEEVDELINILSSPDCKITL